MRATTNGGVICETAGELIDCAARGDEIKRVSTDLLVDAAEQLNDLFQFNDHVGDGETIPAAEWGRRGRMIHRVAGLLSRVETDGSIEALEALRDLRQLSHATTDQALAYSLLAIRGAFTAEQRDLLKEMGWGR